MKVYDGAAFVAAKTGATMVPVRLDGAGAHYFSRLAGIYPRRLFPKITHDHPSTGTRFTHAGDGKARERRRKAGRRCGRSCSRSARHRPSTRYSSFLDTTPHSTAAAPARSRTCAGRGELWLSSRRCARLARPSRSPPGGRKRALGLLLPNVAGPGALARPHGDPPRARDAQLHRRCRSDPQRMRRGAQSERSSHRASFRRDAQARATSIADLGDVRVIYLEDLRGAFGLADKLWLVLCGSSSRARWRPAAEPDGSRGSALHLGLGGQAQGRGALARADPRQHRAGARGDSHFSPHDKFWSRCRCSTPSGSPAARCCR